MRSDGCDDSKGLTCEFSKSSASPNTVEHNRKSSASLRDSSIAATKLQLRHPRKAQCSSTHVDVALKCTSFQA